MLNHPFRTPPHLVETVSGRLAVYDPGGPGAPVLLWPALFTDHRLYDALLGRLDARWRPIRIDGPGFGASDPARDRMQPPAYAAAVIDVMNALSVARALFGGTSWGGQIGAHLAADYPDRIVGGLLMNTPLGPSLGGHLPEVLGARLLLRSRVYANGVARAMLAPTTLAGNRQAVMAFQDCFKDFAPGPAAFTANTTLRHFAGLGSVLPRMAVPVTILAGADDALYPVAQMRRQAAVAANARFVVIPGCGHLAPLEAPEAVLRELIALRDTLRT